MRLLKTVAEVTGVSTQHFLSSKAKYLVAACSSKRLKATYLWPALTESPLTIVP